MCSSEYVNMLDDFSAPRLITLAIMRRKLGEIAKGKAPGFSGNGPDLMRRSRIARWSGLLSLPTPFSLHKSLLVLGTST